MSMTMMPKTWLIIPHNSFSWTTQLQMKNNNHNGGGGTTTKMSSCTKCMAHVWNWVMEIMEQKVFHWNRMMMLTMTTMTNNNNNATISKNNNQQNHEPEYLDYNYLILVDMEGICGDANVNITYDVDVFHYALQQGSNAADNNNSNGEWDVLTFCSSVLYYDLWAFQHATWMPENMYGLHAHMANLIQ